MSAVIPLPSNTLGFYPSEKKHKIYNGVEWAEWVELKGGKGNKTLCTFGEFLNKVENEDFIKPDKIERRSEIDYHGKRLAWKQALDEEIDRIVIMDTNDRTKVPVKFVAETLSHNENIINRFINYIFPICNYCGKRYVRYLFKIHYEDKHICKRCCWVYDIDSIERYKVIDKIREQVKTTIKIGEDIVV